MCYKSQPYRVSASITLFQRSGSTYASAYCFLPGQYSLRQRQRGRGMPMTSIQQQGLPSIGGVCEQIKSGSLNQFDGFLTQGLVQQVSSSLAMNYYLSSSEFSQKLLFYSEEESPIRSCILFILHLSSQSSRCSSIVYGVNSYAQNGQKLCLFEQYSSWIRTRVVLFLQNLHCWTDLSLTSTQNRFFLFFSFYSYTYRVFAIKIAQTRSIFYRSLYQFYLLQPISRYPSLLSLSQLFVQYLCIPYLFLSSIDLQLAYLYYLRVFRNQQRALCILNTYSRMFPQQMLHLILFLYIFCGLSYTYASIF